MVLTMSYSTVSQVFESWDTIRHVKNYHEVVGVHLFRKYFELEPRALVVFSFGSTTELNDEFFKSRRLVSHAKKYVQLLDSAVDMVGPNFELLSEILIELGEKHERWGVTASFYPPMGQAILSTLEELLGKDEFTPAVKDAWVECIQVLVFDMARTKGII